MWIVGIDLDYYPSVEEYKTYEEAKKRYDEYKGSGVIYIAEVKEKRGC